MEKGESMARKEKDRKKRSIKSEGNFEKGAVSFSFIFLQPPTLFRRDFPKLLGFISFGVFCKLEMMMFG